MKQIMKVIGHRGAAGLALENTLPSIELAKLVGVDGIEFDVRTTKDKKLVLVHDSDLRRVSQTGTPTKIQNHTLAQISKITLRDNQSSVPTLDQALRVAGQVHTFIEIKSEGCARLVADTIGKHPKANVTVVSFKLNELAVLRKLCPELELYGLERTKPVEIIQMATILKLNGIGLNFWILNPLTYWLAKRANLKLYVYTVNSKIIGRLIGFLYPKVAICTDHPEYFVKHPYPIVKSMEQARDASLVKGKSKK